jgi:arylamine N-acetyltransferase
VPTLDVPGYLRRLDVTDPGPPSIDALRALHAAHSTRIPYETLEIHLGRPTTVDPYESADRIVRRRRGGYCYHLNGAFSVLLRALGYRVSWHRGGVQRHGGEPGITANHLALTVAGLPDPDQPAGDWFVDVGLGDALYQPLPLRAGTYLQSGFGYRLTGSDLAPGGWRFDHDPSGGFAGMDFEPGIATVDDFAPMHEWLSTAPESGFVRMLTAQRRHATGVDIVRGCTLTTFTATARHNRELTTATEWFSVLADLFGLDLADVPAPERAALWSRTRAAHDTWLAEQAAVSDAEQVIGDPAAGGHDSVTELI